MKKKNYSQFIEKLRKRLSKAIKICHQIIKVCACYILNNLLLRIATKTTIIMKASVLIKCGTHNGFYRDCEDTDTEFQLRR